jgi:beta-glucosidase
MQVDRSTPEDPISPERLDTLVRGLSIEEKAGLTAGIDAWHACGAPSIGLEPMMALDGPNGIRGMTFPAGSSATCTPCGTALGATWDVDLVRAVAARIGLEAKRSGVHYMLGPVLNLVRSPLGGRDFEAYSEDPVLAAMLGAAYVDGMQSAGVAATPKHYVANESETHRTSVDCRVDERTLREVYLVPFEAAAHAGAWSIMAAYNLVNGIHCTDHGHLVGEILKAEWAWDGVLMSDWHATDDTVAGAVAGLDLEMPGPARFFGPALAAAVRRGAVSEAVLDDKARRLLLLAARVGALAEAGSGAVEQAAGDARPIAGPRLDPTRPWHLSDSAAAALVRRAAAESFVLLTNDGTLPLAPAGLHKLAVVGPNAAHPCAQGGGAAHISAPATVTPLDGIRAALPGVEIVYEPGCRIDLFLPPLTAMDVRDLHGRPGLSVEFFRGQEPTGRPAASWHVDSSELHVFGNLPKEVDEDDFAVRMSGWLTPAESGEHEIAVRGYGGRRLRVGGVVTADLWAAPPAPDIPTALFEGRQDGAILELQAGKPVLIEAELHSAVHAPYQLNIGCRSPQPGDQLERAVEAAASADAAIVVVGNDEAWESEGRDRKTVTLPGRQNELVERVAAANPHTVVVVNAGCPMDLPWADRVAAVLYAWLPGQEFGNALADVLLGKSEPGGRLPFTIAAREADYPALGTRPDDREQLIYAEGVNLSYRHFDAAGIEPRFCFGHGVGYSRIEFESLEVAADSLPEGDSARLRVRLRNAGTRAGKEVVQVYVADLESSVPRPPRELKGFTAVHLAPGESTDVLIGLEDRDLAYWDEEAGGWRIEPGRFEILVGASSRDIRLRASLELARTGRDCLGDSPRPTRRPLASIW